MSNWDGSARSAIYEATAMWLSLHHKRWELLGSLSEPEKKSLLAAIDSAYPFGQRRYWPYKVWLKNRNSFVRTYLSPPPVDVAELPLFADK